MGAIKKIFAGLFAFLSKVLGLGPKPESDSQDVIRKAAAKGIFLSPEEARNFTPVAAAKPAASQPETTPKPKNSQPKPAADTKLAASNVTQPAASTVAPAAAAPSLLNLPAAKVVEATTPTPAASNGNFVRFARRRPGANMSSFLAMAKQVKTPS